MDKKSSLRFVDSCCGNRKPVLSYVELSKIGKRFRQTYCSERIESSNEKGRVSSVE
jgi:hypothetical protein